ncbi:MAG: hypothetical protein AB8B48_20100 [Pseudomonadales bacterium]
MLINHSNTAAIHFEDGPHSKRCPMLAFLMPVIVIMVLQLLSANVFASESCKPTASSNTIFALRETDNHFDARFSNYKVCVPKGHFGLSVYRDQELMIKNGSSSVSFMGKVLKIDRPLEFYSNEKQAWLELRGWYSEQDNLWYIARYQFHPGSPTISVAFTITDRHDNYRTGGPWNEDFWHQRVIKDLRFDIETTTVHEPQKVEQLKVGGLFNKRKKDDVLQSQQFALNIKDFWQKYPIGAEASANTLSWVAIKEPTILYGGVGLTIDFALSLDQQKFSAKDLNALVNTPPTPSFPDWWLAMDGATTQNRTYNSLLESSANLIGGADVRDGNWGWKNYGDYQISIPYRNEKNQMVFSWASLQYDLTLGMMLSWMSTDDKWMWDRARAAVRNVMDIQVSKFHPYHQKRSGAGLRKGACPLEIMHWCQEPIPEFNYHSRSLLLYSHLTGETWPKEIARMLIDNSAYFAYTRTDWTAKYYRIGGWALRNLYYGHVLFGDEGTKYISKGEPDWPEMSAGTSYKMITNKFVEHTVNIIEKNNGLGGNQPVWGGQLIEGLIIALENDMLEPRLRERTRKAVETAVNRIVNDQLFKRGNIWWMVYVEDPDPKREGERPELRNFNTYGWFWVNSFAWVSKNTQSDHSALTRELIGWLMREYKRNPEVRTPRAWSSLIGFPSYAINLLDEKEP